MHDKSEQFARETIDTYQENLRDTGNTTTARAMTSQAMAAHATRSGMDAEQAGHLAIESMLAYQKKSRDLPHEHAREAAVRDMMRPGSEVGLDVKNYARSMIDSAQANPGSTSQVIYAHASIAAEEGRASIMNAAKLANSVLKQYTSARDGGMTHEKAREHVAQEVGSRFDERGRDTQVAKLVRHQGQSL